MIGNTLVGFIESLYLNCDKEFQYRDQRFMLQGWFNQLDQTYTLRMTEISEDSHTVFSFTSIDRHDCVSRFENAKLFSGHTMYEAEDEIIVDYD